MIIPMTYPVVSDLAIMTGDYLPLHFLFVILLTMLVCLMIHWLTDPIDALLTRRFFWKTMRKKS